MSRLLWRASLRYLLRHPWQIGLSLVGVALGVAVVVAIDLANSSAQRAFFFVNRKCRWPSNASDCGRLTRNS